MFACKLRSLHPSSLSTGFHSSSVDEVSPWQYGRGQNISLTKRLVTKCPRDEMAGDKLYLRWNGGWWSVPTTKSLVTKRRQPSSSMKRDVPALLVLHITFLTMTALSPWNGLALRAFLLGVSLLCSKIYLLCYAALLQITAYYAQQMPPLCSNDAH